MEPPTPTWNPAQLIAHSEWVRALALRLVRDSAQADDLVQETFLAALERRPAEGRSLRPWLRRVLHNRFAFRARSEERRRAREEEAAAPEAIASSDELVELAEAHARLARELTRLREPYRTVLLLHFLQGLKPHEIARRRDVPAATVRSHLKRGLDELRARLDDRHGGDRRAWSLALVPLAAASRDALPVQAGLTSVLHSLRAMNPIAPLIVGASLVLLSGAFVAGQLEQGPSGLAPGGSTPSDLRADLAEAAPVSEERRVSARGDAGTAGARSDLPESALGSGAMTGPTAEEEKITGSVREVESGDPIPHYGIEISKRTEEEGEWVWTDTEGNFESERLYSAGADLGIAMLDHPGLSLVIWTNREMSVSSMAFGAFGEWDPQDGPLSLKANVGPRFTLALTAPFDWSSVELISSLRAVEREPWGRPSRAYGLRAPVRSGPSPWIRFPFNPSYRPIPEDRPWELLLSTTDGLWAGRAEVEPGRDDYPEPTAITLSPTARLDVTVLSTRELADPTVFIEAVVDGTRRILPKIGTSARESGEHESTFRLGALPPGAYSVLVSCDGFEELRATVNLVGGRVHTEEIVFDGDPLVSPIRGELQSLSGQYREQITLQLMGKKLGGSMFRHPEWVERDGLWVAPFVFDNLPTGEYGLALSSSESYYRWDPLPVHISSPQEEDLILTCRDTDPVRTLVIRVRDGETGEPLAGSLSFLSLEGCAHARASTAGAGARAFGYVPVGRPLQWYAFAEGYVPRWGDESAIQSTGELDTIEVSLDRGWGVRIEVWREGTGDPLSGVVILVDGAEVGATDAEGRFELTLGQPPTQIDFLREGWHFASGMYDPETKRLTGFGPHHFLRFTED